MNNNKSVIHAPFLNLLDRNQKQAATAINQSVKLSGQPGSGKSHTLACRAAYMVLRGINPQSIAVLTCSDATAQAMKRHIVEMAGEKARDILVTTPQSLCIKLRELAHIETPVIYNDAMCKKVIREVAERDDTSDRAIGHIFSRIRYAKERRWSPALLEESKDYVKAEKQIGYPDLVKIYRRYVRRMRKLGAIDLYDLPYESVLMLFCKPGLATRFEHLLVDDYECCTYTQAWMINRWLKSVKTFAVSCSLQLCTNRFLSYLSPKVIEIMRENPEMLCCTLNHDYRQKGILSKVRKTFLANLSAGMDECSPMNVSPRGKVRIIKASNHLDEARKVAASIRQAHDVNQVDYADICVLFGFVGTDKNMFEEVLQQEGVPIKKNAEDDGTQRVTVVTTNNVRGLEYRYVYLVCLNEGYTPSFISQDSPTDMCIEQRTFLIGLSRAKERLFMSASKQEPLSRFVGMCFLPPRPLAEQV